MKSYYFLLLSLLFTSCQSKEEKEKESIRNKITNRTDSLLLFSNKITEEFIAKYKNEDCEVQKQNFKEVQKTFNEIAAKYKEQAQIINIPEDTIRLRMGLSNKVLQDKKISECVGLAKGYNQFQNFQNSLKLKQ